MKRILFDIGANNGSTSIPWSKDSNNIIYAFEPTPHLCAIIQDQIRNKPNYHLIQSAVSDYNGIAKFNIAGQFDWGTSSLLDYADNLKIKWPNRIDFRVTEIINVQVTRLDTFIQQRNILSIDYLHIDTQGSDLNVLYGLGDYLSIVKEGTMEAAYKKDILYTNQNTVNDSCEFLSNNGFSILNIDANDEHGNEANIKFKNNIL